MSQIDVRSLTFGYENGSAPVFENVSFSIDTCWKLGFIGRNGKGKTTFLNLLLSKYTYGGDISLDPAITFSYFPFDPPCPGSTALYAVRECVAPFAAWERQMEEALAADDLDRYGHAQGLYAAHDGYIIDELLQREAGKLAVPPEALGRPFDSLSGGERTKLLIAAMFLKKGCFYLIDEPTNHLDAEGRRILGDYLAAKQGFILVSHDRAFLDRCADHILSINRQDIEVQRGDYTCWEENRRRQDSFERAENERLRKDITRLQEAAREKAAWSDKTERSKIGSHSADRGFIGHKSAKMMRRAKSIDNRREKAVREKEALLKNAEEADSLKLHPLYAPKATLVEARGLSVPLGGRELLHGLGFTVGRGERVALAGPNGCGKSTVLRLCLGEKLPYSGRLEVMSGLVVSYVPQDTSFLKGRLREFVAREGLNESLFFALLRKLDFSRETFSRPMEGFSAGQKKKVLLARSLSQQAHIYLWDEPLNYIDLVSRVQIEELLLEYRPTMLFVEHDERFVAHVASRVATIQA